MKDETGREFIGSVGWTVKTSGGQFVCTCPFPDCGKKDHFYMNADTGLWDCKKCDRRGNVWQLREELGLQALTNPVYHVPETKEGPPPPPIESTRITAGVKRLHEHEAAMLYLIGTRGLSERVVKGMSLILELHNGTPYIGFPWRVGADILGIKWRVLPFDGLNPKVHRFRREKGYKSVLYNCDAMKAALDNKAPIILASGETDLISLLEMGFYNVVATTVGENQLPAEWIRQLEEFSTVYVLFDSDAKGVEAAGKVAAKLGPDRAKVVRLPEGIKDANALLVEYGEEAQAAMKECFSKATKTHIPTVQHIVDILPTLQGGFFGGKDPIESYTPWECVNEQLQRFTGLIVLSAPQNVGKTTFGLQVCDWWARKNLPALFYCLEMSAEELAAKVLMSRYQVTMEEMRENTDDCFARFAVDYAELPFYIGYAPGMRTVDDVLKLLRAAIKRYDLRILFFDNVHVMGRDRDARHIIGALSIGLKQMAMETGCTVVAIAQPRKIELGTLMNAGDLKESSDLRSDADNILLLHRQQISSAKDRDVYDDETESVLSPYCLVRIEKTRFGGSKDTVLYFDGPHHRLRELYEGETVEYRGKRGSWKQSSGHSGDKPFPEDHGKGSEPHGNW